MIEYHIPELILANHQGIVRVMASEFTAISRAITGPTQTFSTMNIVEVGLNAHAVQNFQLNLAWNSMTFILKGEIKVDHQHFSAMHELYVNENTKSIQIKVDTKIKILILSGESLDKPIATYGQFVMNTVAKIRQAFVDFQNGNLS